MKIAIVVREYHRHGGISKGTAEVAERLVKLGHEIHIFTSKWMDVKDNRVIFHKVPIVRLGFLEKSVLYKINKFLQGLTFLITSKILVNYRNFDIVQVKGDSLAKFDIVSAHSCHKAWLKIARKEIKNPIDWIMKNLNPHHWRILLTEKLNYKKGNYKKIVAVSYGVKKEIMQCYNVLEEDIVVIPNGIDLEEFNPKNRSLYFEEVRKEYNIPLDYFVLLFIGYEFRRKGLEFVIKAIAKIKNEKIKLIVVGNDNKKPYEKLAKDLGVLDKVIFVGQQTKVNKFYAASDIFVFPTFYEAFSHVTLEAIASGLPLLTTKVNGTEELITDGKEGFFINRDADDIAEKIKILIEDRNLYKDMSINARKRAEEYSWDNITNKYLELFKGVYNLKNKK
jgi:UDP-glucose:(heptosyl)LPS alpha-1,3-glucosyltransferase